MTVNGSACIKVIGLKIDSCRIQLPSLQDGTKSTHLWFILINFTIVIMLALMHKL